MMARKNRNVRRSNDKGRLVRRQRGQSPVKAHKQVPRTNVEEMVLPDGQCTFMNPRRPKARFATKDKAAAALRQAQVQRARSGSHHVEKRFYRCPEGGCGGYHLTSREAFDENLRKTRLEVQQKKQEGTTP
jgi:hypothetical protein